MRSSATPALRKMLPMQRFEIFSSRFDNSTDSLDYEVRLTPAQAQTSGQISAETISRECGDLLREDSFDNPPTGEFMSDVDVETADVWLCASRFHLF